MMGTYICPEEQAFFFIFLDIVFFSHEAPPHTHTHLHPHPREVYYYSGGGDGND